MGQVRKALATLTALALGIGAGHALAQDAGGAAPARPAAAAGPTQGDLIYPAALAASKIDPAKWDWPAGPTPEIREQIINGHYTSEELRNIFSMLAQFSGNRWPNSGPKAASMSYDSLRAPGAVFHGRGFRGLEAFYGSNGYGGIPDRVNHIDTVIAHGDQVMISWIFEGHHTGMLFGFPGDGKPIHVRETNITRFKDGKIVESNALGDDFALYTQAGGKVSFPDKPQ